MLKVKRATKSEVEEKNRASFISAFDSSLAVVAL